MASNLNNLSPEELINIIISSNTEKSTLSEENRQLKTELVALNSKITQLLDQNATLNKNIADLIAVSQPKSPLVAKKQQPIKSNASTKRINNYFLSVADYKRAKLDTTTTNPTTPTTPNTTNTTVSNETSKYPTSINSSRMDISATDSESVPNGDSNSNETEWHFVDYKKKKNAQNQKIPPVQIDVSVDGRQSLFALLQRSIGVNKYTINQLKTKNSIRVHPANESVGDLLISTLKDHGYSFHSYLGNDKKKQCFVLRGLNGIDEPDLVYRHLVRAGLPDNIGVLRHTTGYQRANPDKNHNTLFKVIVDKSVNGDSLRNIQSIFGLAVRWEKLKNNGITQCHNCQGYFHTSACCYHGFRCVKCTSTHPPGECSLSSDDSAVPHCVNCGGAHTANNHKECKYFLEKIQPIVNRRSSKPSKAATGFNTNNHNNNSTQFRTNGTFASLFDKKMSKGTTAGGPGPVTPVSVSVPSGQPDFIEFFAKTIEMMSKSISNQEKILTYLSAKQ